MSKITVLLSTVLQYSTVLTEVKVINSTTEMSLKYCTPAQ